MLQTQNQNVIQIANERGVVAARRKISAEGQITLQAIADTLYPSIKDSAHLTNVRRVGVNIIGFARFDEVHQNFGPPTRDIIAEVPSTHRPLEVLLGRLGVFGSETKSKLAISLISQELRTEEEAIEDVFEKKGFSLQPGPYREAGFKPHVSIARLNLGFREDFQDEPTLIALEALVGLGPLATQGIMLNLDPVKAHPMQSNNQAVA